ncbi:MAG: hypothetical protein KDF59_02150, partial [Nitrosomonas sp.]|nr:hypothetical protein [Nitrosomonas sp.]
MCSSLNCLIKSCVTVCIGMVLLSGCVMIQERPGEMVDQSSLFDRISSMHQSLLKDRLLHCMNSLDDPFKPSDFSIGHRGAPRFFPEHTLESYQAAAQMGAGIIECDVTFTRDKELVCRHSQCDLHTTTNILKTALAEKC